MWGKTPRYISAQALGGSETSPKKGSKARQRRQNVTAFNSRITWRGGSKNNRPPACRSRSSSCTRTSCSRWSGAAGRARRASRSRGPCRDGSWWWRCARGSPCHSPSWRARSRRARVTNGICDGDTE